MVVPARDDVDDGDDDEADGDARACRAYLRARAMRVWRELVGREVEITLRGDGAPAATGVFAGVDADETTFLVESLTSALGTTPKARVRCSDVLSLRVRGRRDDSSRARDDDDDDGTDRSIAVSTRATEWRVVAIDVIH